jgi:capsular exopolysaccharide synthesis family protein
VPRHKKRKRRANGNLLEVQNAAKTLFANIRFQAIDRPINTVLITSAIPNEGKTTALIFLAQAIATSGKTVLMVDCDMRRRSLATELNIHPSKGIYSVLSGETSLEKAAVETQTHGMYFLDVEPSIPNPADLLASKRMEKLIELAKKSYDYVLFDTPPVGTFVDAAVLAARVDATILAVRPNFAKRSDLRAAYEQLLTAGANIIGICSTFAEGTGSEYYYSYYTKDGESSHHHQHETSSALESADPLPPATPSGSFTPVQQPARTQQRAQQPRSAQRSGTDDTPRGMHGATRVQVGQGQRRQAQSDDYRTNSSVNGSSSGTPLPRSRGRR